MIIVLAALVAIAALLAVAFPIVFRERAAAEGRSSAQEALEELLAQRDAVFQALRELSFDHQVGKITDEDYAVFEANLKQSAAESLRALDRWEAEADAGLEIGRELQQRAAKRAGAETTRTCAQCGQAAGPNEKFCANCGAALPDLPQPAAVERALRCPACGRASGPGDRFCGGCGAALASPGG